MTPFGIYVLANDAVWDWLAAFLVSAEQYAPGVPIAIIPFDHRVQRIRRLLRAPSFLWDDVPVAACDAIARVGLRHDATAQSRKLCRKLAVFDGPFATFAFFDADTLLLRDVAPLVAAMERAGADFVANDFHLDPVYLPGPWRDAMVRDFGSRGFNAGFFLSRRGTVALDTAPEVARTADTAQFADNADQPLLNYLVDRTCVRVLGVQEIDPRLAGVTWAGKALHATAEGYRIETIDGPERNGLVTHLHWAGYKLGPTMPHAWLWFRTRIRARGRAGVVLRWTYLGAKALVRRVLGQRVRPTFDW